MEEQKREFTGLWIPKNVINDNGLSRTELIIYAEIASFTECWKTNESLGERWGLKPNTVSIAISKLIKKKYIVSNNKTGTYRKLKIIFNNEWLCDENHTPLSQKSKRLSYKNQRAIREHKEHNKDNNAILLYKEFHSYKQKHLNQMIPLPDSIIEEGSNRIRKKLKKHKEIPLQKWLDYIPRFFEKQKTVETMNIDYFLGCAQSVIEYVKKHEMRML